MDYRTPEERHAGRKLTPEEVEARRKLAVQRGWTEYIRTYAAWTHWCTGSHRDPTLDDIQRLAELPETRAYGSPGLAPAHAAAMAAMKMLHGKPVPVPLRVKAMQKLLRRVAQEIGQHVPYVWTADPREQSAIHFLIAAPSMTVKRLDALWVVGNTKFREYDPALVVAPNWGAVGYIARHRGGEPDPNVACTKERRCRRGCQEAPSSW